MSDLATRAKAEVIWEQLNASQRFGIRVGLFPAEVMRAAEKEGFGGRELCVALMDVAKKNGGMHA